MKRDTNFTLLPQHINANVVNVCTMSFAEQFNQVEKLGGDDDDQTYNDEPRDDEYIEEDEEDEEDEDDEEDEEDEEDKLHAEALRDDLLKNIDECIDNVSRVKHEKLKQLKKQLTQRACTIASVEECVSMFHMLCPSIDPDAEADAEKEHLERVKEHPDVLTEKGFLKGSDRTTQNKFDDMDKDIHCMGTLDSVDHHTVKRKTSHKCRARHGREGKFLQPDGSTLEKNQLAITDG